MTLTYRELSVNLLSISNSEISLGKDSHNERVAVPWREIGLNPKKFIHPKYIPDNVAIQDPSHMQSNDIRTLCAQILRRQSRGEQAFQFQAVLPNHRGKGSTKKKWQDLTRSSSDSHSESESESEGEQEEEEHYWNGEQEQHEQQEHEHEHEHEEEEEEVEEEIAPKSRKGKPQASIESWEAVL
jgi:hypothetical protein